ncbi:MAG: pantoate--beta-alanine ligase [Pseudomonadota bacterium]
MKICPTVQDIRAAVAGYKAAGESVGLVTTMGALHEGHLTLMRHAREAHDRVVATIFVNPTQFGEVADLAHYPSDDARDIDLLKGEGVDALFLPKVDVIYPPGDETIVETVELANKLHGKVRPGHFRGVATVVARLFNICLPDAAYFGEKDYQQLQVIKRMVRDLHFPLEIVGVPTVREGDGLAMSSRNVRLTPEDRAAAVVLNRSLNEAEALVAAGTTVEALGNAIRATIKAEPRAILRAVDIVAAETLEPVTGPVTERIAIMLSAEFGSVLLIDQREITP